MEINLRFSAGKSGHSLFGLVNVKEGTYIGDMESNLRMKAKADERGIWVSEGNLLSEFDPDTLADKEIAFHGYMEHQQFQCFGQACACRDGRAGLFHLRSGRERPGT